MVTVEERNVTEETKFIMAARLLRSYIHENLTGTKATRYIKNKRGMSRSDLIFVAGMVFQSDFLPVRKAADKILEGCYLANALNPTITQECYERAIKIKGILGELSYINACLESLQKKYIKTNNKGKILRIIPTMNFYKQCGLYIADLEILLRGVLKSDKLRSKII